MKKYLVSICVLSAYFQANASQTFVSGDHSGVSSFDDFDVYVQEGANVSLPGNTITMTVPVHLYNSGVINGSIDTNGHNFHIYNSGIISGEINASSGGEVIQHIRSDAELTDVNVVSGVFNVEINDYQNADFNNIKNINANSFTIADSKIIMNDFNDWQNWDENVVLDSNVILVINDPESVHSGEIIRYAAHCDNCDVLIPNLDKMYKRELVFVGDELVLNIVRETDYSVVFDEESGASENGAVLELIRRKHGKDKLLSALDSASNWDEIERIKKSSYRFNHDILLRPMKTINNFSLLDAVKSETETGVGITPYYTFSDKMDGFGGRVYVGYENEFLYVNAGIGIHKFDYSDKFNEFSGVSYAFDIKSRQHVGKFFLGEAIGLTLTDFSADYVSKNSKLENNPLGVSFYGDVLSGYDFEISPDIKITPNIGVAYQRYNIADVKDDDYFGHIGTDVKYSYAMDGIKYEYSLSGGGSTDGDLYLTMGVGFMSITDAAGISANAGILKDEVDMHYKFSMNAKVLF